MHTRSSRASRRELLQSFAAGAALVGAPALARAAGGNKKLIVVMANGGWDVTYCMDPKVGEPEIQGPERHEVNAIPDDREEVRTFADIPILCNAHKRPSVTRFFEDWGHRTAVVNGIWMGSITHARCRERILTGTASAASPDVTAIAGHVLGTSSPLGAVDVSGLAYSGQLAASSGRIGIRSQLKALLDANVPFPTPEGAGYSYPLFVATPEQDDQVRAFLAARAQGLGQRFADGGHNDRRISDFLESADRAGRLQDEGEGIAAQLNLGSEPNFSLEVTLAVDLLKQGLCKSVLVDSNRLWDTHTDNALQHGHFESIFSGLNNLMAKLSSEGMLEEVVVAVVSEMTRTPKYNGTGGKDHWAHTSALLLGPGVVGGRTRGGSDPLLESLPVDLATGEVDAAGELNTYENFAAGLLELMDVDPAEWFPTVTPFRGAMV